MDHKRSERLGKIVTDLSNSLVTYPDTGDDLLSSVEQCILRAGKRKRPTSPKTRPAASHGSMPLGSATTPSQRANPVTSEADSSNKRRKVLDNRSEFIKSQESGSEPLSNFIKLEPDPSPVPDFGDNGSSNNIVTESTFSHSLIPNSVETSLGNPNVPGANATSSENANSHHFFNPGKNYPHNQEINDPNSQDAQNSIIPQTSQPRAHNQDYPPESGGEDKASEYTLTAYDFRRDFQKFHSGSETLELERIKERTINYQHVSTLSNNGTGELELDVSDLSLFPPPQETSNSPSNSNLLPDMAQPLQTHQSLPDATLPQIPMSVAPGSTPQVSLNKMDECISEQDRRMLHPNILNDFEEIFTEAMSHIVGNDENRIGLRRALVFCGRLLGQDGRQNYADLISELKRWNGPDPQYQESLPTTAGREELVLLNQMVKAYQYSPSHRGMVTSTCIKHARRGQFYRYFQRWEQLMDSSNSAIWNLIQMNGFEIPGSPGYWYGNNTHLFVDFFLLKATGLDLRWCMDEQWAWKERRKIFRFIEISRRLYSLETNFGGGVHALTPTTGGGAFFEKKEFERDGDFKASHIGPVMQVIRNKYPWVNRMCRYIGRRIVKPFVFEHKDPRELLEQVGQMYEEGADDLKAWQEIVYT